jgi:photosynthetic reaction center H subunit
MRDNMRNEGMDRLVPLHDLKDFKVAKEDPDARGWKVIGADGERFGKVKDLIVDPREMKARYLDVEVDRRLFNEDHDRHLLVPIGAATLDREDDKVFVPFIDRNSIAGYPAYQGGPITEDYEYAVREAIIGPGDRNRSGSESTTTATSSRDTTLRPISNDFYEHEHFNEDKFFRNRRQDEDKQVHFVQAQDRDQDRDRGVFEDRDRTDLRDQRSDSSTFTSSSSDTPGSRKKVEESISTIERLEQLRVRGSITEEEFRVLKKRALDI